MLNCNPRLRAPLQSNQTSAPHATAQCAELGCEPNAADIDALPTVHVERVQSAPQNSAVDARFADALRKPDTIPRA